MKKTGMKIVRILSIITIIVTFCLLPLFSQEVVPLAYGDMDNWVVREIKESAIIGGKTKHLYEVGPSDTIIGNEAYTNRGGSPWANSNVMAKVAGVVKTNTSVFPEDRNGGKCARLETHIESVKVFGLIDIEVLAAGSLYLGKMHEPIKGTKNPQSMLESGIAFTGKPKALRFDYKTKIMPNDHRIRCTGFSLKTVVEGSDESSVVLMLQKRWEDKDGRIFAKRIGTMVHRFTGTTKEWVNEATYPVLYGDITSHPEYKEYMKIQVEERYMVNSKGESVPILETGWADEGETPTHLILQFASSHGGAYIGTPGNTLWVDNVALVY